MIDKVAALEGELDRLFREVAGMIARQGGATGPGVPRREHLQAAIDAIREWEDRIEHLAHTPVPATPLEQLLHRHFQVTEEILELEEDDPD